MFDIEYRYRSDAGISSTYAPSLISLGIAPIKTEAESISEAKSEKLIGDGELDLEGKILLFFLQMKSSDQ